MLLLGEGDGWSFRPDNAGLLVRVAQQFDGRGWRITPGAPDRVPVAMLDEQDHEMSRPMIGLSPGALAITLRCPRRPAAFVGDPDRLLFDRNLEQDRQAVRRATVRP